MRGTRTTFSATILAVLGVQIAVAVAVAGALYVARREFRPQFDAVEQWILTPRLTPAHLGDGRPAADMLLCYPMGLALNGSGELLISDRGRDRRGRLVWRIDDAGNAHIVAGTGRRGVATASHALDLDLDRPESMAVAPDGSIFLSDGYNHVVLRIAPHGNVERFAGTGSPGFSGDDGPAAAATLFRPADIRLDRKGNLFIADVKNNRVRRVDPSGRITTVAGNGEAGFSPDGTPASAARFDTIWGLGLDREDRLLIGDGGNHRVRRVDDDGRLLTLAGSDSRGYAGDGGPATQASLNFPEGLSVDPAGRLYISDEWNNVVRMVDTDGTISTVIGTGFPGRAALGGVARSSPLDDPESVLWTRAGLLVADGNNGRVIRVSQDGIIELVAGRSDTASCAPRW